MFPYVDSSNPVTAQFLNEVANKGLKYITENNNRDTKVVNFKTPEELEKLIDFKVKEDPENLETILNEVDNILKYVVRTGTAINVKYYDIEFIKNLKNLEMMGFSMF